jgi:hypothetical protein
MNTPKENKIREIKSEMILNMRNFPRTLLLNKYIGKLMRLITASIATPGTIVIYNANAINSVPDTPCFACWAAPNMIAKNRATPNICNTPIVIKKIRSLDGFLRGVSGTLLTVGAIGAYGCPFIIAVG